VARHDHPIKIQITGFYKTKFFGARLGVRALVSLDFVDDADHEVSEVDDADDQVIIILYAIV